MFTLADTDTDTDTDTKNGFATHLHLYQCRCRPVWTVLQIITDQILMSAGVSVCVGQFELTIKARHVSIIFG